MGNKSSKDNEENLKLIKKVNILENSQKEYFRLLHEEMRTFYHNSFTQTSNLPYCLSYRKFNDKGEQYSISLHPEQTYIHWKTFLLSYLLKQSEKGIYWATELKELVMGEQFLSEHKWLSLFFLQIFNKNANLYSDTSKTSRNTIISPTNNDFLNSDKTLNSSSFVSLAVIKASAEGLVKPKDNRTQVKAYIKLIKQHIFDESHPINDVVSLFVNTFGKYLYETLEYHADEEGRNDYSRSKQLKLILKQLQKFVIKVQISIKLMYGRVVDFTCFEEDKDDLLNLLIGLIFNKGKLYELVYDCYKMLYIETSNKLNRKFVESKGDTPEDCGIPPKFSLNSSTIEFQKKICTIDQLAELEKQMSSVPYKKPIQLMQTIGNYKSPFEKLLLISSVHSEIRSCITTAWEKLDSSYNQSLINIEADDLMSIFIYILKKAEVKDLYLHLQMMTDFSTSLTRSTLAGYYLVTMQAAVAYILDNRQTESLLSKQYFMPNSCESYSFLKVEEDFI